MKRVNLNKKICYPGNKWTQSQNITKGSPYTTALAKLQTATYSYEQRLAEVRRGTEILSFHYASG